MLVSAEPKDFVMHIHYCQHVPFEGLGTIEAWALKQGHSLSTTKFYQNDRLPVLEDFDFLIVMGGPMNIYEEDQYPWLRGEKILIQQAIIANKILLGICLGAQLIAEVLGAQVFPGEYKEMGWFPIELLETNFGVFEGLPPRLTVFHWHGDTFPTPPGATRLAFSEACANQAFIYNSRVLGLQFHLESTPSCVQALITHCGNELTQGKYIQTPSQMLEEPDRFWAINQAMVKILTNLCY